MNSADLRRNVAVCGGEETLSRILNASIQDLRRWMEGNELAPTPVFNRAVEIANAAEQSRNGKEFVCLLILGAVGDSEACSMQNLGALMTFVISGRKQRVTSEV